MNIVISIKSYFPALGGSIIYCRMFAEAFSRAGHQVTVITRTPGDPVPAAGYNLIRVPSIRQKWKLAGKADVLMQVESSWTDAWPFLLRRVPWFPTVHRGYVSFSRLGLSAKIRLLSECVAYRLGRTIGVSNYVVRAWKLREPAIPNPYETEIFCESAPEAIRDIDVLFVGRITRDKGTLVLMEALEKISLRKNVPLRAAFVGTGPAEALLREKAARSGIEVFFPGKLEAKEVANWMHRSKVLAFPTTPDWLEASPLTPLEAAACGCLVVASDSGGTSENISPSHWLVRSGCPRSLETGLLDALARLHDGIDTATRDLLARRNPAIIAKEYIRRFQQSPRR